MRDNHGVVLEDAPKDESEQDQIAHDHGRNGQDQCQGEQRVIVDPAANLARVASMGIVENDTRGKYQRYDPADQRCFDEEVGNVRVEDANEMHVLNERHDEHPHERGEKEVMEEKAENIAETQRLLHSKWIGLGDAERHVQAVDDEDGQA